MRLFLFTLGFCSFLSCGKEDDTAAKQLEADILIINEYLAAKGLSAQKTASGLHYIITDQGNGLNYPNASSYVTVAYRGYFPNGVVFDQSTVGDPPPFSQSGYKRLERRHPLISQRRERGVVNTFGPCIWAQPFISANTRQCGHDI